MRLHEPQRVNEPDKCRTTRPTQRDVFTGTRHSDSSVRREYPRNDDALAPVVPQPNSLIDVLEVPPC